MNLDNMKMRNKLIGLFIVTGIIPVLLVGLWSAIQSRNNLIKQSFSQLEAVRGIKKVQIEKYFRERQGDMAVLTETAAILRQNAFHNIEGAQATKKRQVESFFENIETQIKLLAGHRKFQDALAAYDNGFRSAGRQNSRTYRRAAEKYDAFLETTAKELGVYDIYLITPEGDIVGTAARESDRWTNCITGKFKNSNLAQGFRRTKTGLTYADFQYYKPSQTQAAFVLMPFIKNTSKRGRWKTGESIGIIAFQIPDTGINRILHQREGMGETGESYLVGKWEGKTSYRSDRIIKTGKIGQDKTGSEIEKALSGQTGIEIKTGSSGDMEIEGFSPINLTGLNWALVTTISYEEAVAPVLDGEKDDFYTHYNELYGYYDLFLINPNGYVFYSVTKEADYRTNMITGKFASSNLGTLVRDVIESKQFGFADFAPYAPSNGEPAAFIAQPIIHKGQVEMVVALQLPLNAIDGIMQQRDGMGKTGETYLVGPDKRMRSNSFLDPHGHSVKASFSGTVQDNGVNTEATQQALSNDTDTQVIIDYNGNSVLSSYTPLNVWGTTWALVAEIDQAEVMGPIYILIFSIIIACLVVTALGFMIASYLTRGVLRQLGAEPFEIEGIARKVSKGDLSLEIDPNVNSTGVYAAVEEMVCNLKETVDIAGTIAEGDLTVQVNKLSEEDALGYALETMVRKLSHMISEIRASSGNVSMGAEQLSSTAQAMSQGATEQASSLEEISSSMSQIAAQVQQNAENGEQANTLASDSRTAAEQGNSQMDEMVSAMTDINESSQQIAKIIKVIDEIAFQTNLLALNAAVEAARAGKYGKGFAVVAEEVRNLAVRSASAAKEITEMIETSVRQVEAGTGIVDRTAESLQGIISSVGKIADLVGEVAAASKEQAVGVNQITEGLDQIDKVTQSNSAHAEESAAASEELSAQANTLQNMIDTFRTSEPHKGEMKRLDTDHIPITQDDSTEPQRISQLSGSYQSFKPGQIPTKIHLDDDNFGKY